MKKNFLFVLLATLFLGFSFASCGSDDEGLTMSEKGASSGSSFTSSLATLKASYDANPAQGIYGTMTANPITTANLISAISSYQQNKADVEWYSAFKGAAITSTGIVTQEMLDSIEGGVDGYSIVAILLGYLVPTE